LLKQNKWLLDNSQYIIVKGKKVKVVLPEKYRIPENLSIEKMVHDLAKGYTLDPKYVETAYDEFDFFLMKVMNAQQYVSELFVQLNYYT
jgi:hypothetical protein